MIVHPDNPIVRAYGSEIRKIYLGQIKKWRGKIEVIPVHQKLNSDSRKAFFHKVMKMKEFEYSDYWKLKTQQEKAKPPVVMNTALEVVRYVKENKNAIGYINAVFSRDGVKLLFIDGSEMW